MYKILTYKKLVLFSVILSLVMVFSAVSNTFLPVLSVFNTDSHEVIVLMYHQISENSNLWGDYVIPTSLLKQDFEYLKSNNYTVIKIKDIIDFAHSNSVPVLVDGAQAVPHIKVDVRDLDADFYAFSAHKMYGPTGIGVLYGKKHLLEIMPPYQGGGEMIANVSFDNTTFAELPFKFEAGTPDFVGIAAFNKALDFIDEIGYDNIAAHEHALLTYTTERLMKIPGMKIFGTSENKSAVISFLIGNEHHYDFGMLLDTLGIEVRTGHHCAQPLMRSLGIEGTVRASFAVYNTFEEADKFIAAVERVAAMLK